VQIDVHITDDISSPQVVENTCDEDSEKSGLRSTGPVVPGHRNIAVIRGKGRPDLEDLIRKSTIDVPERMTVAVTSCGPASMGLDIRNACAEAQKRIFKGKQGAGEVWLHCEAFGW